MTTHNHSLKFFLLAAAAALGLAVAAHAQSANVAVPKPGAATAQGLLGSPYAGIAGNYADLGSNAPSVARGWNVYYNQPLVDQLDLTVDYNWMRAHAFGLKITEQRVDTALTGFLKRDWGKPFVTAGVNWDWINGDSVASRNGFGLLAGTGVEFQVAPAVAVTPYVNFVRETGYNQNEFDYGAKATYRFNPQWSTTLKVQYDDIRQATNQTEYSLGVNYHF